MNPLQDHSPHAVASCRVHLPPLRELVQPLLMELLLRCEACAAALLRQPLTTRSSSLCKRIKCSPDGIDKALLKTGFKAPPSRLHMTKNIVLDN
jgi:hypothetical protein